MRRRWPLPSLIHVLALCAMALLNVAVVRSTVMQAAPMPMARCADMAGMAPPGKPAKADAKTSCAFCAAAAHAPATIATMVLAPPSAVIWRPLPLWRSSGPRGPPAVCPTARGPPALPMI